VIYKLKKFGPLLLGYELSAPFGVLCAHYRVQLNLTRKLCVTFFVTRQLE